VKTNSLAINRMKQFLHIMMAQVNCKTN